MSLSDDIRYYSDLYESTSADEFYQEKIYIAKKFSCKLRDIVIDDNHPTNEVCIFVKGKWCGYIDNMFYSEMFNK